MMALRFRGDPFVPDARFETLKREFGAALEDVTLEAKDGYPDPRMAPHSVLTLHLVDDDPEGPTKTCEQRVIQFFKERTGA